MNWMKNLKQEVGKNESVRQKMGELAKTLKRKTKGSEALKIWERTFDTGNKTKHDIAMPWQRMSEIRTKTEKVVKFD